MLFAIFFPLCSCVRYTRACVGIGVTLGHNSKGRQEPCMHHKSLLSLVSSISSKQGCYRGQVPHLCLCATRSRVESWSQTVNSKKVNPTAGILNNLVLTRTLGCFLSPPFSSPFPSHLAILQLHTHFSLSFPLLWVAAARLTQPSALFLGPDEQC